MERRPRPSRLPNTSSAQSPSWCMQKGQAMPSATCHPGCTQPVGAPSTPRRPILSHERLASPQHLCGFHGRALQKNAAHLATARNGTAASPARLLAAGPHAASGGDVAPEGSSSAGEGVCLPIHGLGPVGQMLLHLLSSGQAYLVPGAAEPHLQSLSRKVEEMSDGLQSTDEGADAISALLARRVQQLREKEARLEVGTIIYLCGIAKLQEGGVTPRESLEAGTVHTELQWQGVLGPALADGVVGHLGGMLGGSEANQDAVAHVAAEQLAGLYLGMAEFGYFLRTVQGRMAQQGLQLGADCSALLDYAEALPMEEVRLAAEVRSKEAAHALRQHVGGLFQLETDESQELGNPYPGLRALSGSQIAPTAHLLEHFDDFGKAEDLTQQAASKASRGWTEAAQRDLEEAGTALPVPDLLEATIRDLRLLMLEAAGLGCALWEAETEVWDAFPLRPSTPATEQTD